MAIRSLGKVTVVAAGTPVRLTTNEPVPSKLCRAHAVFVQAWHANAANIFVGAPDNNDVTKFVVSTGQGMIAQIPPPTASSIPNVGVEIANAPAPFDVSKLYVDGATGESVLVAITET